MPAFGLVVKGPSTAAKPVELTQRRSTNKEKEKVDSHQLKGGRNPGQLLLLDDVLGAVDGLLGHVHELVVAVLEELGLRGRFNETVSDLIRG
jgi:hypothetical protein